VAGPGIDGSDFFLRFKGVIVVPGIPAAFSSSPLSRLGLLTGLGRNPTASESCRGESPLALVLFDDPFIPGRRNAAAEIFFVVVGVNGDPKIGDICGT
jgi:hypothetical protein